MDYKIKECEVEGVQIITPMEDGSCRAYLTDLELEESQDEYRKMGIEEPLTYHYRESYSRGVLRGIYFQRDMVQSKFLAVTRGSIYAVVVDLRSGRDYGAAFALELSAESGRMLYIPPYFAHGFLTLEAGTEVVLNSSHEFSEDLSSGIIYDDQVLAIDWQFDRWQIDEKYLNITQRDRRFPSFRNYNQNALWKFPPDKRKARR